MAFAEESSSRTADSERSMALTLGSFYSFWYVWVGLYAFFFFGRRWGAAHMVLIGVAYGWVLTQVPQTSPIARWVMTIATIAIASVLVDALARRVRQRAAEADSRARSQPSRTPPTSSLATPAPRGPGWWSARPRLEWPTPTPQPSGSPRPTAPA